MAEKCSDCIRRVNTESAKTVTYLQQKVGVNL